jgi:beta-glucosidase
MMVNTDDLLDEFCAQSVFSHLDDQGNRVAGLKASYYEKEYWQGASRQAVVAGINGDASRELPPGMDAKAFSVKWTGQIAPAETAGYAFITSGYNRMEVLLDGAQLIVWRGSNYIRSHRRDMHLEAGKTYNLEIRYSKRAPISPIVHFGWGRADQIGKGSRVEKIAAGADVVIACVGYGPDSEGEGIDRTWRLPGMQRELLDLVTSANSNTMVIANAGNAFETESWIKKAPAFLHAFYSGQEGGQALKEIIFGETNPSGKLPFTFGKTLQDYPVMAAYDDRALEIPYKEGVFVGYRGFDREGRAPLFAFGAGLSYATFALSDMKSSPVDGRPGRVRIDCKVRNTGTRPGSETVQLYVGERNPAVPRPVRELKGFRKIALQPGESAPVEFLLDRADFGFYDTAGKCWKTNPGEYEIFLGHSSQNLPLHETLLLK